MNITIRLFAGLAELLGGPVLQVELPQSSITADELKGHLAERYPEAAGRIEMCFFAKNQTYAAGDEPLGEQDEIALIPPVSGGQEAATPQAPPAAPLYVISYEPIDVGEVAAKVGDPNHGAALAFVGTTRELTAGQRTVLLEYEAYVPMALSMLAQIGAEIDARWPGTRTAITHRLGEVGIGETSVVIAVSAPHRASCYEASRYAIERLKQIVPIWKKERWADGSEWKGSQTGPWNPLAVPADGPQAN
ncbi:molybdopterin converting factor subunit 1 [Paenibacillus athensensis]|uniref:Molybdopterin synthase catalytic subunit n=1 Tax=Paenibacillus athensensis TaxID=1967502 RepID=A0A4Y8PYJ8_9BACL|nr:molybdopterin converting factor subunit 1 [Paenibacillus athensensis]MCD1258839.1 molybdopterin converting factor subunit 1 [Paenibacillus athensensis]